MSILQNRLKFKHLERLSKIYIEACSDLLSYLYDLGIESQNTLLSDLFPNRLPGRVPLDKSKLVIDTSPETIRSLKEMIASSDPWNLKIEDSADT